MISPRVVKLWWWATMRKDYCTPPSCPDRAFFPFPPCPTFVFYCNIYGVFKVFLVEKVQRDFYFSHQTILKQNNVRISKQGVFKYANNSMAHLMQNIRLWNLKRKLELIIRSLYSNLHLSFAFICTLPKSFWMYCDMWHVTCEAIIWYTGWHPAPLSPAGCEPTCNLGPLLGALGGVMLGADELPAVAEALPAVRQIEWTRVTEIDSRYYSSLSLHKCILNCSKTIIVSVAAMCGDWWGPGHTGHGWDLSEKKCHRQTITSCHTHHHPQSRTQ